MQKKLNNIIIIGNFPTPINGVSILNEAIYNAWNKKYNALKIKMNTSEKMQDGNYQGKLSLKKINRTIWTVLKGLKQIKKNESKAIYMVPGESYLGFIRYFPFVLMATIMKKDIYIHIHGEVFYKTLKNKHNNIFIKFIINKAKKIIVLSERHKKIFEKYIPKEKMNVCLNGVPENTNVEISLIKKKIKNYNKNKIKILYLSNLIKEKGILDLIEAVKLISETMNIELELAGNIEPKLKNKIENELEINKFITYHGVVSGEIKENILKKCEIFCLPSYLPSEAVPLSILEAMFYGYSIVTTNQGSIGEIFKDDINGKLCIPKDISSIKDSILQAHKYYEKFSYANYFEAKKKYSFEKFLKRLESIFEEN